MARRPARAYRGPMRSGRALVALTVLAAASAAGGCGTTATRVAQDEGETHAKAATPSERRPDGARYDLDLAYDARRFTLSGTERITFRNGGADPMPVVWLRAWANAFGGCRVSRAHVTIRAGGSLGARRSRSVSPARWPPAPRRRSRSRSA